MVVEGFFSSGHRIEAAGPLPGWYDGKEGHHSRTDPGWFPNRTLHRAMQWSSLTWRFQSSGAAAVRLPGVQLSSSLQLYLCAAAGDHSQFGICPSHSEPTRALEPAPQGMGASGTGRRRGDHGLDHLRNGLMRCSHEKAEISISENAYTKTGALALWQAKA